MYETHLLTLHDLFLNHVVLIIRMAMRILPILPCRSAHHPSTPRRPLAPRPPLLPREVQLPSGRLLVEAPEEAGDAGWEVLADHRHVLLTLPQGVHQQQTGGLQIICVNLIGQSRTNAPVT